MMIFTTRSENLNSTKRYSGFREAWLSPNELLKVQPNTQQFNILSLSLICPTYSASPLTNYLSSKLTIILLPKEPLSMIFIHSSSLAGQKRQDELCCKVLTNTKKSKQWSKPYMLWYTKQIILEVTPFWKNCPIISTAISVFMLLNLSRSSNFFSS